MVGSRASQHAPTRLSGLREGSRSRAAGRGGGDPRPRERAAPPGEGAPGAQAPPPARAGREGEAVASADRAKRSGERGGGCRPRPGGTRRVGAGSRPTRSRERPLLSRRPPPRTGLSIHKFSSCSAATGRPSPPGAPRSRPPARRPWAVRPETEVGAAGPGLHRAGGRRAVTAEPGIAPAPGPALARDPCLVPARPEGGSGGSGRAWEPTRGALHRALGGLEGPSPAPPPGLSFPPGDPARARALPPPGSARG